LNQEINGGARPASGLMLRERRSGVAVVVVLHRIDTGGSFWRKAIKVVLKFWCNWQMRQSPHPVCPLARFPDLSECVSEATSPSPDMIRPCRCAASTVVP